MSTTALWMVAIFIALGLGFFLLQDSKPTREQAESSLTDTPLPEDIPNASIAVLPFEDLSANNEFAFFASGMHQDILENLSRIESLLVISRSSVQRYADSSETTTDIALALKVAHILRGSVRRDENWVHVEVRLERLGTEHPIWTDTFEAELTDIFTLQAAVAEQVASFMGSSIDPSLIGGSFVPTVDTQAYDWFIQGRELIRLPSADSARRGLFLFRAAVERDPDYADAHAGIALALKALSLFDVSWEDVKDGAMESARRAIELDADSAYAFYAMGSVLTGVTGNNPAAELHLQRAIELDPNYGDAYVLYSENQSLQSKNEKSFELIRQAARRDPFSATVRLKQGEMLLIAGKRAEALDHISTALALEPDNAYGQLIAGRIYDAGNALITALGHYGRAHALDMENVQTVNHIAGTLTRLGFLSEADAWLEEARRIAPVSDTWFYRKSQLLTAQGHYASLAQLAEDWGRYNPAVAAVVQLRASAASLEAEDARLAGDIDKANALSLRAIEYLTTYLAQFKTEDGYRAQFNNLWNLLTLGIEERRFDRDSGNRHFQSVVDLYESLPEDVQLPNQRIHLTIAYAALGEQARALKNVRLSLETDDYTYWVFRIFDLEQDRADMYHGLVADPRYQQVLADLRESRDRKQQRLIELFPAILSPDHEDWKSGNASIIQAAEDSSELLDDN